MATSSQPTPQGQQYVVDFKQSINLDNVAEKVYPFDNGVAPHLTNTGILRDDGVTNLYETTYEDVAYTGTWYAPNGARINVGSGGVYVNDRQVATVPISFGVIDSKTLVSLDVALSTTGTIIALVERKNINGSRLSIVEMDYDTEEIINTKTYGGSVGGDGPFYACLVKTPQMTFSNAAFYLQTVASGTMTVGYIDSSLTFHGITTTTALTLWNGISAFGNGGTVVLCGIPTGTGVASYYNTTPGNYNVWGSLGVYVSLIEPTVAIPTYTTLASLSLLATSSTTLTVPWTSYYTGITISSAGALVSTPVADAGLSVAVGDRYSGFGYASGKYTSATATVLSPFYANLSTIQKRDLTVTAYAVIPDPSQAGLYYASTVEGKIVQVGVGRSPVCEYGYPSNRNAIVRWSTSAASTEFVLTIPGQMSSQMVKASATGIKLYPVSQDLVTFCDGSGLIINTATYEIEYNKSMVPRSFISDMFLVGTKSMAWQTNGRYANSPDVGQVNSLAGYSTGVYYAGYANDFVFYQSDTAGGTLYAIAGFKANTLGSTGGFYVIDTSVAYVPNPNITPPSQSVYSGGGVSMVDSSAYQTVNFATAFGFAQYYIGYTLANQYPINYQFFNLFGQLYGFDGTKIYRMPVNGATVGTPEQVAVASGLVLITNAPTMAWFYSSFDNSVYVFDGGQNVQKWQEMTGKDTVVSGNYSVLESSLYLSLSDNTLIVFRDGMATQLSNPYSSQIIYATDGGTYFVNTDNTAQSKKWSYYAGTGTPITLTWQSGFYGFGRNQWGRITQVVFTIKVADPATTDVTINYKWLTSTDTGSETKTFTGGTYSASSTNYVRFQYNPTNVEGYGCSVGISCTKKVTLYECVVYYTDGGVAMIPNLGP